MSQPLVIKFGTDGWRGIIADDFTFPNLRRVATAAATYFKSQKDSRFAVTLIGYDRRFFSKEFALEVASVFRKEGLSVRVAAEALPTPAISVCLKDQRADWGLMMTASHNPALYNGFKVKDRFGRSAPPEITREIETCIASEDTPAQPSHDTVETFDYRPAYDAYVRSRLDFNFLKTYKGTVVFDYLYGAGAGIPERLLKGTSVRAIPLHAEKDPLFGGLHPEPIEANLEALQKAVRKARAQVGIAVDGDADRLGVVDEKGTYLTPHQVFPLLTLHCIEQKGWKGKIVQSVSLGALGERIAQHFGLPFEEVPVGFKHVAERMLRENIVAGGEESGGYAFQGGLPERDGVLNGLLFVEMLAARRATASALVRDMERRFGKARFHRVDLTVKSPVTDKEAFAKTISDLLPARLAGSAVANVSTLDGVKIRLKSGAWLLLRPSGTEPLLRTYAESDEWAKTRALLAWAQSTIEKAYGLAQRGHHA